MSGYYVKTIKRIENGQGGMIDVISSGKGDGKIRIVITTDDGHVLPNANLSDDEALLLGASLLDLIESKVK